MSDEREEAFETWFAREYPYLAEAASRESGWGKEDQEYARIAKGNMLRAWRAALQYASATAQKPVGYVPSARKLAPLTYVHMTAEPTRIQTVPVYTEPPAERVEVSEEQWRIIQAPTGNALFDAGVRDACNRIRALLARAKAKEE